jgi:hypothetical protein
MSRRIEPKLFELLDTFLERRNPFTFSAAKFKVDLEFVARQEIIRVQKMNFLVGKST